MKDQEGLIFPKLSAYFVVTSLLPTSLFSNACQPFQPFPSSCIPEVLTSITFNDFFCTIAAVIIAIIFLGCLWINHGLCDSLQKDTKKRLLFSTTETCLPLLSFSLALFFSLCHLSSLSENWWLAGVSQHSSIIHRCQNLGTLLKCRVAEMAKLHLDY